MVSSSSSSHLSSSYPPIHTHPNLINSSLISSSYSPATPTSRIGLGLRRRPGFFPLVAATTACSNFTERESLYDVLGVSAGASGDEIKAAYRTLARIHHPDARKEGRESFPSGADEFMRIHAAYSTLSDPEKRAEYDRSLRPRRSIRPLGSNDDDCVSSFWRYPRRNWETDQCW